MISIFTVLFCFWVYAVMCRSFRAHSHRLERIQRVGVFSAWAYSERMSIHTGHLCVFSAGAGSPVFKCTWPMSLGAHSHVSLSLTLVNTICASLVLFPYFKRCLESSTAPIVQLDTLIRPVEYLTSF